MTKILKLSSLLVLIFVFVLLVGCAPKDVDSAKQKMTEAGYLCAGYEDKDAEGLIGGFGATKGILTKNPQALTATLYDSSKSAKAALAKIEGTIGENEVIEIIGNWLVWGTEEAIKEFKK